MQTGEIILSTTLPAKPEQVYNAWLNSKEHGAFTGGDAEIAPQAGSNYSAWDKYITDRYWNLSLAAGYYIPGEPGSSKISMRILCLRRSLNHIM